MTPYQRYKKRWSNCCKCELAEQRRNMVHVRGSLPCKVLFIGEAPGQSEDVLGQPFVGPAGKLLDQIIDGGLPGDCRWALCNLVACYPRQAKDEGVNEPPRKSIVACLPRLRELVAVARPEVIICVGKLPSEWIRKALFGKHDLHRIISIMHPSAMLRIDDYKARALQVKRAIVAVRDSLEEELCQNYW